MNQLKLFLMLAVIAVPLLAQPRMRFAHISDTHVGSETGAEDLRRTVADLNGMSGIDFAVISGDITEYGSDVQLNLAKQILDSLSLPWYIVPGNHDMKWSESGGASFSRVFGSERFVFDHQEFRFIGVHQGPRLRMGDAYWTMDDVAFLDSVLRTMHEPVRRAIIVTHYPLDSGIANWFRVSELAHRYPVQAYLNGHWHRNHFAFFDGVPGIVGRSNLRAKDSVGGYNIVEIIGDTMRYAVRIPGVRTKQPWATVLLTDRRQDAQRHQIAAPSNPYAEHYPFVTVERTIPSRIPMHAPPVIAEGKIIIAYDDGRIRLLEMNGNEYRTIDTRMRILASPALSGDDLVVPSADGGIHCFSLRSGKKRWTVTTAAAAIAPPVIDNGTVYCGASDRSFRAIELKSGALLWSFDGLEGHVESAPLVTEREVIFGAWDEHLYCLDRSNGSLRWKWRGNKRGTLLSPAVCEPVTAHGTVFIVAPDRYMTALDLQSGKERWRTGRFKVRETIGISEDKERVYVRTMNDSLYAFSTASSSPEPLWGVHAGFGYDINSSQLREKNGILYCTTKNGMLLAVEGTTGRLIWKFQEDVVIAHTPVPLGDSRVLFSNVLGTVAFIRSVPH